MTTRGPQPGERVYLVDAHNMVHKLYHAVPQETSPSGADVNAVIGWVRSLRALRRSRGAKYLLPIFDGAGHGWRKDLLPDYKAKRKEPDPELVAQWPLVRGVTEALQLPVICVREIEADDLIAAYTKTALELELEVLIVSGDKDLLQLVTGPDSGAGSVRVLPAFSAKAEPRGPAYVEEKFGVGPDQLGDLLALAGDKSDGIPGVPGVGLKGAARILADHGSLEAALDRWSLVPGKLGERLHANADMARLCRKLVAFYDSPPQPVDLGEIAPWVTSRRALDEFFRGLGYSRFEAAVDARRGT